MLLCAVPDTDGGYVPVKWSFSPLWQGAVTNPGPSQHTDKLRNPSWHTSPRPPAGTDHTCLYSHTRNIYSEVDRTNHLIYSFLFRVSFYFPTRDCNWFQSDAGSHGGDVGMGACSRWWRFLYRDNERKSLEKGKVKIFRQKNNCCNSGAAGFLEVSLCSERIQIPGVRRKRKCRERMRD